jgi:3-oxoacyl-[acyl-carrier protein] reductase
MNDKYYNYLNNKGIITGVGKGIGLETLKYFLNHNYKIVGISKTKNKEIEILELKYPNNFFFFKEDISKFNLINKLVKLIFKKHKDINFLVNNAGIRMRSSIQDISLNQIKKVVNINLISQMNIIKSFVNNLKNKSGSVVSISSIVGPCGLKDLSSYAATKSGLEGFSRSLAVEFAKNDIRFNCIAPGFIETDYIKKLKKKKKLFNWINNRIPMKRFGQAKEIAPAIEFLISEKSSYITGSTIFIDGGWSAS